MVEYRTHWSSRVLLILVLGPLPVGILAFCHEYLNLINPDNPRVITAGFGAAWGLTAGVLRKSLLRALIGLNLGAALGLNFGSMMEPFPNKSLAVVLLILHGAVLSAAINFSTRKSGYGLVRGVLAGALAFGVMAVTAYSVTELFRPNLLGWTVMSLFPFGLGMFLFLRLIANKPDDIPAAPVIPAVQVPSDDVPAS